MQKRQAEPETHLQLGLSRGRRRPRDWLHEPPCILVVAERVPHCFLLTLQTLLCGVTEGDMITHCLPLCCVLCVR